MTAPACGSCGSPVGDGATLCSGCTRDLAQLLLTAASIATDLDDAIARLLKRGPGGRRSDTEAPLPIDLGASEAARKLRFTLAVWSCVIRVAPEPPPADDVAPTARWLVQRLPRLRQHHHADAAYREIREDVQRALAVVDRKPERVPAGLCDNCGRQLLAELGADTVTCGCGMTALALQDKRRERAQAADVLGTAAAISGALKAIGITVPRGTITSWASRGRLLPRPGGAYALSDVLALHAQSQSRAGRS